MSKLSTFFEKSKIISKLKSIKHIEIYLVIILAGIVLLIWFGDFGLKSTKASTETKQISSTVAVYTQELENKLEKTLSQIEGAGEVCVMITLDGSSQLILAYETENKSNTTDNTTSSGTSTKTNNTSTNSTPIIINTNGQSSPLVLSEIMPNIKGVVVVCEGAGNIRVKLNILEAIQALLGVNSSQVEIFVKG